MSVTRLDLKELETVNRYLAGRLSETECADFEQRLTHDPELVRELESIARFKVGLQVLHERGELEAAVRGPHWSYRWVAIAAAIAVLAVGVLTFQSFITPSVPSMLAAVPASLTDRQGNVLPSAGTFTVLRKRATTADVVLELPPQGRAIQLKVLPESPPKAGDGYAVSLWQQPPQAEPRRIGSLSHITPDADGFIVIFMDTTPLTPGEYLLVVSPTLVEDRPDGGDVFRISMSPARK